MSSMPDIDLAHPDQRPRDLSQRHLTYRVAAMPADTNGKGDVFGGWLMSQVDIAGSVLAMEAAGGRVATVAINRFQFISPVLVGDLVSCYARVVHFGATSIQVELHVDVERMGDHSTAHRVAEALLTYVALTDEGKPRGISKPSQRAEDPD